MLTVFYIMHTPIVQQYLYLRGMIIQYNPIPKQCLLKMQAQLYWQGDVNWQGGLTALIVKY